MLELGSYALSMTGTARLLTTATGVPIGVTGITSGPSVVTLSFEGRQVSLMVQPNHTIGV